MSNSNFTIFVTYDDDGKFSYKDEGNKSAETKDGCHAEKTIQWHLQNAGKRQLTIEFPNGNPFDLPGTYFAVDTVYTFNKSHKSCYKYNVILKDAAGKPIDRHDPHIMFDDGGLEGQLGFAHADEIAKAAEAAWEKLFDKLRSTRNDQGASTIQFYPHGINDIEVSVGFSGITVQVKVSGPSS